MLNLAGHPKWRMDSRLLHNFWLRKPWLVDKTLGLWDNDVWVTVCANVVAANEAMY